MSQLRQRLNLKLPRQIIKKSYLSDYMALKGLIAGFILKLNNMLQERRFEDVISWQSPQIIIKDRDALVDKVLPLVYRHTRFESFIRQLNLYGFHKVPKNTNGYIYFKHKHFRVGETDSLALVRLKGKQMQKQQKDSVKVEEQTYIDERKKTISSIDQNRGQLKQTLISLNNRIKKAVRDMPELEIQLKEAIGILKLCLVEQSGFVPTVQSMFSIDSHVSI